MANINITLRMNKINYNITSIVDTGNFKQRNRNGNINRRNIQYSFFYNSSGRDMN